MCQCPNECIHSLNTRITALNSCRLPLWWEKRDPEDYGSPSTEWGTMRPTTWSSSKTSPSWPTKPFSPTTSCWVPVQAVPEGQGEGPGQPHLPLRSHIFSIPHPPGCHHNPPQMIQMQLLSSPQQVPGLLKGVFQLWQLESLYSPMEGPEGVLPDPQHQRQVTHSRGRSPQGESRNHSHHLCSSSRHRSSHLPTINRCSCHTPSWSPSCNPSSDCSHRSPRRQCRSTRCKYCLRSIELLPAPSLLQSNNVVTSTLPKEGTLSTSHAWDDQTTFHTTLQLTTKQCKKQMMVKIDPGAQANTVWQQKERGPWAFFVDMDVPWWDPTALPRTVCCWCPAYITAQVIPTHFYVFWDSMSPQILLSYTVSDCLGFLEFKVPNEAPYSHINEVTLPNMKMKNVIFQEPLVPPTPSSSIM